MDFISYLSYNVVMKKVILTLGLCVSVALGVNCAELTISSPAGSFSDQMEEINSSFAQVTPKKDRKARKAAKAEKKKAEKVDKTKTEPEKIDKKETVHTVEPAEKSIKAEEKTNQKENKRKEAEEKQKQQYRELQELSNQYQQGIALYTDNNLKASLEVFSKIPEEKRTPEIWLLMGNIMLYKKSNPS